MTKGFAPDIVIGCGSSVSNLWERYIMEEKILWESTKRGIWYSRLNTGGIFIYYSHPEARVADNLLFYGLIDTVREISFIN